MEEIKEEFHEPTQQFDRKQALCKPDVPLIPKRDRILVIQHEFVQRKRIYIPDTAQAKPTTGTVVAIGPDVEEGFVRLDEAIVFSLYAGVPISVVNAEGEVVTYLSLREDEIAGELMVDPASLKT